MGWYIRPDKPSELDVNRLRLGSSSSNIKDIIFVMDCDEELDVNRLGLGASSRHVERY